MTKYLVSAAALVCVLAFSCASTPAATGGSASAPAAKSAPAKAGEKTVKVKRVFTPQPKDQRDSALASQDTNRAARMNDLAKRLQKTNNMAGMILSMKVAIHSTTAMTFTDQVETSKGGVLFPLAEQFRKAVDATIAATSGEKLAAALKKLDELSDQLYNEDVPASSVVVVPEAPAAAAAAPAAPAPAAKADDLPSFPGAVPLAKGASDNADLMADNIEKAKAKRPNAVYDYKSYKAPAGTAIEAVKKYYDPILTAQGWTWQESFKMENSMVKLIGWSRGNQAATFMVGNDEIAGFPFIIAQVATFNQ